MKGYRKSDTAEVKKKKSPKENKAGNEEVESVSAKGKGKTKFVPLFGKEGLARTAVYLPGRHECQCLAGRHQLVGNCTECGRIVCQQEGSGPCLTCGALVCSREEREVLSQGNRKSEELLKKLMGGQKKPNGRGGEGLRDVANNLLMGTTQCLQEGLDKAIEHKNQLLEYDKTCERRTHVIDDEADYFSVDSNQWLGADERQALQRRADELRSKLHASRRHRVVTLDFAGRQVIEEQEAVVMHDSSDSVVRSVYYRDDNNTSTTTRNSQDSSALTSLGVPNPVFEDVGDWGPNLVTAPLVRDCHQMRLQDKELQEMSDLGWCVSVHQPYASLLVSGIKKHEGRSWYTAHRGRLWIASAAKPPLNQEIREVENAMRIITGKENITFPEHYPTGCLLGSIDVVQCLPQEEYQMQFPDGESGSPYVFICTNPQELIAKFPLQGKPKLFKLDGRIHQAAQKTLRNKKK